MEHFLFSTKFYVVLFSGLSGEEKKKVRIRQKKTEGVISILRNTMSFRVEILKKGKVC